MTTTAATTTVTASHTWVERDKYGRTTYPVIGTDRHQMGAIVLRPKVARQDGRGMYMTNLWSVLGLDGAVEYHATKREAFARFGLTTADIRR